MGKHGRKSLFLRQMTEAFVQGDHAQWKARPVLDRGAFDQAVRAAFARHFGIHPGQFRGPTTNIDHEDCFRIFRHQVMTADCGEPRFFLRVDDLEGQAGFFMDPADEFRAVLSLPAGLGRNAAHPADAVMFQFAADRF